MVIIAPDVDELQQLGNGRDFVGLLAAGDLAQRQPELAGPDAHRVQGTQAVAAVVAATGRLAVHRQDRLLDAGRLGRRRPQRCEPIREARLKRRGVQQRQHPAKDILAGHAVGQIQGAAQELLFQRPIWRSTSARWPRPRRPSAR